MSERRTDGGDDRRAEGPAQGPANRSSESSQRLQYTLHPLAYARTYPPPPPRHRLDASMDWRARPRVSRRDGSFRGPGAVSSHPGGGLGFVAVSQHGRVLLIRSVIFLLVSSSKPSMLFTHLLWASSIAFLVSSAKGHEGSKGSSGRGRSLGRGSGRGAPPSFFAEAAPLWFSFPRPQTQEGLIATRRLRGSGGGSPSGSSIDREHRFSRSKSSSSPKQTDPRGEPEPSRADLSPFPFSSLRPPTTLFFNSVYKTPLTPFAPPISLKVESKARFLRERRGTAEGEQKAPPCRNDATTLANPLPCAASAPSAEAQAGASLVAHNQTTPNRPPSTENPGSARAPRRRRRRRRRRTT